MGPIDISLLRSLPRARRATIRLAIVGVVSGVVALGQALAVAWMVSALVADEPLGPPLALVGCLLVTRGVLAAVGEIVDRRAGHEMSGEVRLRLLSRWLSVPTEHRPSHDAALGLAGPGVSSIEPYVARYLPALVTAAVVPILAVVVMFFVDPWSVLILLVTLPLLPFFAALIGKHTAAESDRRWAAMHLLAGHFLDVVRGLPTLVAYGRAEHQVETVAAVGDRHRRASTEALRTAFLSSVALELLATISVAMVAVAVGLRLAYGTIELDVGLAAILLAPEAYWPIRRVGQEFHSAADGAAVLDQITPDILAPGAPVDDELATDSAVIIDSVSFGYPDRPRILDGLSLRSPEGPGLTVVTGPSGSGKSTLLDLVAGVRSPEAGTIAAPPAHLATQRPLLMPGSVLDALRLGAPEATDHSCTDALRVVGLWPTLEARAGLETSLGDDGVGLSAGQRTRLALARAMLSDAPLVMLDEPTAHVDLDDLDDLRDLIVDLAITRHVIVATHDAALVVRAEHRWDLPLATTETAPPQTAPPQTAPPQTVPPQTVPPQTVPPQTVPAEDALNAWQRSSVPGRLNLACALGGFSMAAGVALTATSGWLVVQASTQPVVLTLIVAIVGVRAFGIARPLLRYAERVVSHDAALETLTARRVEVYRRLIPLTPARLGRRNRSDLLTAIVTDLDDAVDEQVRVHVPWWSTVFATAIAVLILLVVLPMAAVVVVVGGLLAFAVSRVGSQAERGAQDEAVRCRARVLRLTTQLVDQIDEIRALTAAAPLGSGLLLDQVERSHRSQGDAETSLIRSRAVTLAGLWIVVGVTAVGVATAAASGLADGAVSAPIAALVALTPIALADIWVGLADIGGARARAAQAEVRLAAVLDQDPAVLDLGTLDLPDGLLPVVADDISATWSSHQPPLGPFTLPLLDRGARAQITGPNGIGKSTMLAVLARNLPRLSGTHLLHGIPADEATLAAARADIAVVGDAPHAFAGSIRANLALAAPDATDADILAALAAADLTRWLHRHPNLLDTNLTGLSGGERTRLAIARAALSQRDLVLLDEPTAHLDDATANRALASLLSDSSRAIVAVSHQPVPGLVGGTIDMAPVDV